ncbi:alpha/beta-hydrolase [Hymenopellis radicata]|nr:alpha/beta-hydrolase [Hymenopellis radicata]
MLFTYRHQPLKLIYTIFRGLAIVFCVPWWTVRNLLPSWRPRTDWTLSHCLLVEIFNAMAAILLQTSLPAQSPVETLVKSSKNTGFVAIEPTPGLIVGDIQRYSELNDVKPTRVGGFWHGAKGPDNTVGQRASPGEKVVFHLHGGGFVMGTGAPSDFLTTSIVDGLLKHCAQFSRVLAMEYRLASGPPLKIENPFPTALVDIIAGYHYLVQIVGFEPQNVIISGDSAGGVLAYQLARYLISSNLPDIPAAGALLLLSPSADSSLRAIPGSMIDNTRSDLACTWITARYGVVSLLGVLPEDELDKPWLSPGSTMFPDLDVKGLFTSFPPTLILAGEAEMTRDCMRVLRDRMRADMGEKNVTYVETHGAPHDVLSIRLFEPHRTEGLKKIAEWVSTL